MEYAFGGHDEEGTGIYEMEPRKSTDYKHRESIEMGRTALSARQVQMLVLSMQNAYLGREYDVIKRNCNTFSNDLVTHLVGVPIPDHVNRLARTGSIFSSSINKLPGRWRALSQSSGQPSNPGRARDAKYLSSSDDES